VFFAVLLQAARFQAFCSRAAAFLCGFLYRGWTDAIALFLPTKATALERLYALSWNGSAESANKLECVGHIFLTRN
jgi:hypothetical protein